MIMKRFKKFLAWDQEEAVLVLVVLVFKAMSIRLIIIKSKVFGIRGKKKTWYHFLSSGDISKYK